MGQTFQKLYPHFRLKVSVGLNSMGIKGQKAYQTVIPPIHFTPPESSESLFFRLEFQPSSLFLVWRRALGRVLGVDTAAGGLVLVLGLGLGLAGGGGSGGIGGNAG